MPQLAVTRFDLDELTLYHRNPRQGDVNTIARSLEINGQYRPIVVNLGTKTGRPLEVLAGNHTVLAAKQLGWHQIDAVTVDHTETGCARIVAADNRTADLGKYDDQLLAELLADLPDLDGTGYNELDLANLTNLDTQQILTTRQELDLDEFNDQTISIHLELTRDQHATINQAAELTGTETLSAAITELAAHYLNR